MVAVSSAPTNIPPRAISPCHDLAGRRCRGGLAFVAVIETVAIAVAEMGVLGLELRQDDTDDICLGALKPLQGAARGAGLDRARLDYIDHTFHGGRDQR